MSNLSIFEENVIHSMRGAALCAGGVGTSAYETLFDEAETIFLRWKDRHVGKSEQCALEWCAIDPFLTFALHVAMKPHASNTHSKTTSEQTIADLRRFIRERHERRYFPGY